MAQKYCFRCKWLTGDTCHSPTASTVDLYKSAVTGVVNPQFLRASWQRDETAMGGAASSYARCGVLGTWFEPIPP